MKKNVLYLIVLMLAISLLTGCQQNTESNKNDSQIINIGSEKDDSHSTVQNHNDQPIITKAPSGYWKQGHFVDDFGDPLEDKFISANISGTYEIMRNNKTGDAKITIQILEDWKGDPEIAIKLYKGSSLVVNNDTSKTTKYTLRVKDDEGNTTDYACHMYKTDKSIVFENNKDKYFIQMMMNNKLLKVVLMDELIYKDGWLYDYNAYSFNIDTTGFKDAYEWLGIGKSQSDN